MELISTQIEDYEGKCALCKYFRPAYSRTNRKSKSDSWLDDPGWCVRYPPVFVGGNLDPNDQCDTLRYGQPGVDGFDGCGEYVRIRTDEMQRL